MLGEALSFPTQGDGALKTIAIGGVLLLLSVFLIPILFLQGYLVRVLRAAVNDEPRPPTFGDWGGLLVDGLKLLVVAIVYFLPATVLFVAAFAVIGGGALLGGEAGAGVGLLGGLLAVLAVIVALVATYFLPAGVANFAVTDSVGAAFDLGTVTSAAFTSEYAVAVILAIVVGGIINAVGQALVLVLVGVFVLFYGQVVVYYLFGRGFAKASGHPRPRDTTAKL